MAFALNYLDRHKIKDKKAGLEEPSGLALAPGGDGLWTVSDDTGRVFRLDLDGRLVPGASFDLPATGLEGITVGPAGRFLYAIREERNEILKLDIAARHVVARQRLADMAGYDGIAPLFAGDDPNKGLEGIAWNEHTGTLFLLKEGDPGLLIEVLPDLQTIRGHTVLDARNGFTDPEIAAAKVDFSGLCYEPTSAAFWIVSDKGQRLYLYSPQSNRVLHAAALTWRKGGKTRNLKKAEGVAWNPATRRLYVVSDKTARLYVYEVRP